MILKFKFLSASLLIYTTISYGQFTSVSGDPSSDGLESQGVSWVDYDNDGDDDLFVTMSYSIQGGLSSKDLLYQNNGDGTFSTISTGDIVNEEGAGRNSTWADFNNDGFIDVFIANQIETVLFKNNGSGTFTKVTTIPTGSSLDGDNSGGAWGDYNSDGYLDLFLATYKLTANAKNLLFKNNGDETFTKISTDNIVSTSGASSDPSWIDYDHNGTLDLFVPNYCATNFLYSNQGDGTLKSVVSSLEMFNCSTGASWADYDNDGDFDVLFQNNVNQNNQLFENNGDGSFVEKTNIATSVMSSSSAWGDFDNDGNIDIIQVGSGQAGKTFLHRNNGNKTFTDVSSQQGIVNLNYSWAVAWADYDKDGFLDCFIANSYGNNLPPNDILYHNTPNTNGWINIKLKGTNSNRSAIGSVVKIKSGTKSQWRTVQSKTGHNSQNSLTVHFGIGSSEKIDTILVEWPNRGYQESFNQPKNQFIEITELNFPLAPTKLIATNNIPGEILLNWTDNSGDENGFRVERSKGSTNNFKLLSTVPGNSVSVVDKDLKESTSYYYRVSSITSGGFSSYSNIASIENLITGLEPQKSSLTLYPNPATEYFTVEGIEFSKRTSRKLIDVTGQNVLSEDRIIDNKSISVKDLPAGLFILVIGEYHTKVLKR